MPPLIACLILLSYSCLPPSLLKIELPGSCPSLVLGTGGAAGSTAFVGAAGATGLVDAVEVLVIVAAEVLGAAGATLGAVTLGVVGATLGAAGATLGADERLLSSGRAVDFGFPSP